MVEPDDESRRAAAGPDHKLRGSYEDLEAALEHPEVTHVLIALPNDRTPAALVRAIEAGKGVFTEKPGARSAAEFEPVLSALDRRPVPFTIAYLNRWSPPVRQIRELYRAGAIGRLTSVELRMVTTQVGMRNPGSWLFQREAVGGGVLAWLGCHWLDALRFVTGEEIVRVQAELATTSGEAIDVEDTAAVAFRTAGGAVGSLHAGYVLAVGNPGYRAAGHDIVMILRGTLGAIYHAGGRHEAPLLLESVAPGWRSAPPRTYQFTAPPSRGYGGPGRSRLFPRLSDGYARRCHPGGCDRRAAPARSARRHLRGGCERVCGRRAAPRALTRRLVAASLGPMAAVLEPTAMAPLAVHAVRLADKLAVVDDRPDGTRVTLTFAELNREANRLAHVLADLGIKRGDRLAWCGPNSPGIVRATHARRSWASLACPSTTD